MTVQDPAGRVALVTGAAGGLGQAICSTLKARGWRVTGTDVTGVPGVFTPVDLREPRAAEELVGAVLADQGRLDLLVNNAATMYFGLLSLEDLGRWWDTIEVNLSAPFRLCRAAAGPLAQTRGQIINVSSIMGVTAESGFSAYCASKHGIIGLTKALAHELAPHVRVNSVAPGDMDTPQQAVDAAAYGLTREELYARHAAATPIGRVLDPAEVADLIAYLGDATAFTGSCIHINGGKVMI
jgi:NAD(P)-dependent dehydrogenase (short-subunit alcohol dehydrogenase family)